MAGHLTFLKPNQRSHLGRVCDVCAMRKVKCFGSHPCHNCTVAGVECTNLRIKQKPGPKGPGIRRARRQAYSRPHSPLQDHNSHSPAPNGQEEVESLSLGQSRQFQPLVPLTIVNYLLTVYESRLYPVWPIVSRPIQSGLLSNLETPEVYCFATALCAVTVAQLDLDSHVATLCKGVNHVTLAEESERIRNTIGYGDQKCSTDILLSSFFLHIACANRGQVQKATLLLREAIAFAHLLELHKSEHYDGLDVFEAQLQLRIYWLLFITDRGHSTRFDLPATMKMDPALPKLEPDENLEVLLPFIDLCALFNNFGDAITLAETRTSRSYFDRWQHQLQNESNELALGNDFQRADFLITRQWMQLLLWKLSLPRVPLDLSPLEGSRSLMFPQEVAGRVMSYLTRYPQQTIQAHGLGMEMKLCDMALSLINVITCIPVTYRTYEAFRLTPQNTLAGLVNFLLTFRGGQGSMIRAVHDRIFHARIFDADPHSLLGSVEVCEDDTIAQRAHDPLP